MELKFQDLEFTRLFNSAAKIYELLSVLLAVFISSQNHVRKIKIWNQFHLFQPARSEKIVHQDTEKICQEIQLFRGQWDIVILYQ